MAGRLVLGIPIRMLECIAQALSETPRSARELATLTGYSPQKVARILTLLVDHGRARLSTSRRIYSSRVDCFYSKPIQQ